MRLPYNNVHIVGDVLLAARGGSIHSFSVLDGSFISSWTHPLAKKSSTVEKASALPNENGPPTPSVVNGPPTKRQRVEDVFMQSGSTEEAEPDRIEARKGKKSKGRGHPSHGAGSKMGQGPDTPIITNMASTADGKRIVAVTGNDKTIWTFENNGSGHLHQLSQRAMPKRPSSVVISQPDAQLLCADKFGDVYALPLDPEQTTAATRPASFTQVPKMAMPAASTLTVHSKRNRAALENQIKQAELNLKAQAAEDASDVPAFESTLLLGHVSMLTALVLGEDEEKHRKYIITADRDEHIRVSRYMPQSHIIEGFCLGHREFVHSLVIPRGRPELLVSGGGDQELFTWDWKASKLLTKVDLAAAAAQIAPGITQVAVSGLYSLTFPSEDGDLDYILAICEDVNAIFSWQVVQDHLTHPSIIQLPGAPLSLAVIPATGTSAPKIAAAVDPGEASSAKSMHIFAMKVDGLRLQTDSEYTAADDEIEAKEPEVEHGEVRKLLYSVAQLRKQNSNGADEAGQVEVNPDKDENAD